nr:hypothetical protein [Pseudomonas sp. BIGb0427]
MDFHGTTAAKKTIAMTIPFDSSALRGAAQGAAEFIKDFDVGVTVTAPC